MILTDRTTLSAVKLSIADGVLSVVSSVLTPTSEPIIADVSTGDKYKLFVSNGIVGIDPVGSGTPVTVTEVDETTGVTWIFEILTGVLGYKNAIAVSTARDSRIAQTITGKSSVSQGTAITAESRIQ